MGIASHHRDLAVPLVMVLALISANPCPMTGAEPVPGAGGRTVIALDAEWRFHRGDLADAVPGVAIATWRWREGGADEQVLAQPGVDDSAWAVAADGEDTFKGRIGFAWYRAVIPAGAGVVRSLSFTQVDDTAEVWINGVRVGPTHTGWNEAFTVPVGPAWHATGPNLIAVRVGNDQGPGEVQGARAVLDLIPSALPASSALAAAYDDRGWRTVEVPHDYVVEGSVTSAADTGHGSLPVEPAWYRRSFTVPTGAADRRWWLEFDGVYRDARVWLDGVELGHHPCGYSGFRFDVSTALARGGSHQLTVRVDPTRFEGWFYEGGGIYRHVRLVGTAAVAIAPDELAVSTTVADPGDGVIAPAAVVQVQTVLTNAMARNASARVRSRVLLEGRPIASGESPATAVVAGGSATTALAITLDRPHLWGPGHPVLYTLDAEVVVDGAVVDRTSTTFGVRSVALDAQRGFLLNGQPVKLQGVCNHQDHAGVGIGLTDSLMEWRVRKMQSIGANAWRTAHNPTAPSLYEACDRLGMLVMDENRHLGDTEDGKARPGTRAEDLTDLTWMIKAHRNHPSIVLWSLCNEEFNLQGSAEGGRLAAAMKQRVLAIDSTRPVLAAVNSGQENEGAIVDALDVLTYNYGIWAYDSGRKRWPDLPFVATETASEVGTRGIYTTEPYADGEGRKYTGDPAKGYVSAYGTNAPSWAQPSEEAWNAVASRPFVAGGFVWTGFDYKGETTPYGWPCVNSHFGILDLCGFEKDSAWYYRAWWGSQPSIHLLPHWTWPGREGKDVPVRVYSNAAKVELLLNGTSLGVKDMPRLGHLEWTVRYAPGRLEARGLGGSASLVAAVETTGVPARLVLEADRNALTADGQDTLPVTVRVVDGASRTVPVADTALRFRVSGPVRIAGVGNGDPSSHELDQGDTRRAFNGLAQVLLRTGHQAGSAVLTVEADGLPTVSLELPVR